MANDFRPWETNYLLSGWRSICGLMIGWGFMLTGHPAIATLAVSLGTWYAWQQLRIGRARERGIEVELAAVRDLREHLDPLGYDVQADLSMGPFRGNIDALVRPPSSPASFVVEIKSHTGFIKRPTGFLTKHGDWYPQWGAVRQVRRQCRHLGRDWHFPVLWCPESKLNSLDIHNGILLVNGDIHLLRQSLAEHQKTIPFPASIQFPKEPPLEYRKALLRRSFKYDGLRRVWHGRTAFREKDVLAGFVAGAGGKFWFKERP